jgi:nucleoid-associated protein YgaU
MRVDLGRLTAGAISMNRLQIPRPASFVRMPLPAEPLARIRRCAMTLIDKYKDLFQLANTIGLKNPDVKEESGKLKIKGKTEYQLDANRLWDNIKTHGGWEQEIVADIQAERTDVYGVHTVTSGETLSKLAKQYLGDANRYMELFNANKSILTDPNTIKVGQKLTIPASR